MPIYIAHGEYARHAGSETWPTGAGNRGFVVCQAQNPGESGFLDGLLVIRLRSR